MVGLATPAATPAILPANSPADSAPKLHAWVNRGRTNGSHPGHTLSTIPQSPGMGGTSQSTTPASTALSAAKSPRGDSSNGKDYFSFPSKKSKATTPGPNGTKDPSPTRRPDSTVPQTPGGSQASFMGKFKGFGGKGKKASDSTETSGQGNGALMSPKDNDEDATEVGPDMVGARRCVCSPNYRSRNPMTRRQSSCAAWKSSALIPSARLSTPRLHHTISRRRPLSSSRRPIKTLELGLSPIAVWSRESSVIWKQ